MKSNIQNLFIVVLLFSFHKFGLAEETDGQNEKSKTQNEMTGQKNQEKPGKIEVSGFHYMPFGIGQFINGDDGLGAGFLATQGVAFTYANYLWLVKAESHHKDSQNKIDELSNQRDSNLDPASEEYISANNSVEIYTKQRQEELDNIYSHARIVFGIFGAFWLAGVFQAISDEDLDESKKVAFNHGTSKQSGLFKHRSHVIKPTFSVNLRPDLMYQPSDKKHSTFKLMLDLKLSF